METPGWRNKKICIIDDDVNVRTIYRAKFQNDGFTVCEASNGQEGLILVRAERPDCIVVDVQMPVLDGIGVLRALKDDAALASIPVIVLSNVEDDAVFHQVEQLGVAKYYLIKSLTNTEKVVDTVVSVLTEK